MSNSRNWILRFAGRVLANALVGGIIVAIVGALCVAAAGAIVGAVIDISSSSNTNYMGSGAFIGMIVGAWSGIVGALTFGVAASLSKPERFFAPLLSMKRVALGQLLGTVGALSFYFAFVVAVAQTQNQPFAGTVEDNLEWILFGAPTMMICGAIAGAILKRD